MGAACLADERSVAWLPSLVAGRNGAAVVQHSLAELHVRDLPVDWAGYFAPFGTRRVGAADVRLPAGTVLVRAAALARDRRAAWPTPTTCCSAAVSASPAPSCRCSPHVVTSAGAGLGREHKIMGAVLLPGTAFFEAMRAAGDAIG